MTPEIYAEGGIAIDGTDPVHTSPKAGRWKGHGN